MCLYTQMLATHNVHEYRHLFTNVIHEARILCISNDGDIYIYILQNGSNGTQQRITAQATKRCCANFFLLLLLLLLFCVCMPYSLSSYSCVTMYCSSCVRLFILRAFVRPHLMSIVSILNFIDSMFVLCESTSYIA